MLRFKLFTLRPLNGIAFLALWIVALSLTGCDTPSQFEAKYPKDATVIEDVVEFAEKLGEGAAEQVLKLPNGSLQMVFDHKLFVIPAETVQAAKVAGVAVPAPNAVVVK